MIDEIRQAAALLQKVIAAHRTPPAASVPRFLVERCDYVPGAVLEFKDVYEHLKLWCRERGIDPPGKMKVIRSLPSPHPYGIRYGNKRFVGNVVFLNDDGSIPAVKVDDARPWIARAGRLKRVGD